MSIIDDILQKVNLKFEELNSAERETLLSWSQQLDSNQLTLEAVKFFVHSLRDSVEQELTRADHGVQQDLFLKARLRNLMLLDAFLTSPDRAKKELNRAIAGMVTNRKV